MKNFIKKLPILFVALFELLVGIMLFVAPDTFTEILVMAFGAAIIVVGIIQLIGYFKGRDKGEANAFTLTLSIVFMLAGLLTACFAGFILSLIKAIVVLYGAMLVIFGIYKIGFYIELRTLKIPVTGLIIISGIVSIVAGAVIACNPTVAFNIAGIALIVEAVADIVALFLLPRSKDDKKDKPADDAE